MADTVNLGINHWLQQEPPAVESAHCFHGAHDDCRDERCPCRCGHPLRWLLAAIRRGAIIERAIDRTNEEVRLHGGYLPPDFESTWSTAPQSIRHGCEMDSAEYFFIKGQQAEQEAAVLVMRGKME